MADTVDNLRPALEKATREIESSEFFEAHDTLEEAWHELPEGPLRTAVQGLIQLCAGLHKRSQGQARGAEYLITRGLEKVERCGAALPAGAAGPFLKKARLDA